MKKNSKNNKNNTEHYTEEEQPGTVIFVFVSTFSRFSREEGMKNQKFFMKDEEKEVEADRKRWERERES